MKTLIIAAAAAASFSAVAEPAADIAKTLKLTDSTASWIDQMPASIGEYAVDGPVLTRAVVGYDGADPVYGDYNGVVATYQVTGFDGGDAVYGNMNGVAVSYALTPEQAAAMSD